MRYCTYVGIDTHSQKHSICAIKPEDGTIIEHTITGSISKVVSWLVKKINSKDLRTPINCVYEAGPTGFSLYRLLREENIDCVVAAPSKLPRRTDRVKNDRTDAKWLAQMLVAGSVRAVNVPKVAQQSLLELSGLRASAVKDLVRAKQRVGSFMMKNSIECTKTKSKYNKTFFKWASSLTLENEMQTYVFKELVAEVQRRQCLLESVNERIASAIKSDPHLDYLHRCLKSLPQVGDILAFSMLAKVRDIHRFKGPNAFASYWGITPGDRSSGKTHRGGPMTKKGDDLVRSLLMEASTGYLKTPSQITLEDSSIPEPIRAEAQIFKKRIYERRDSLLQRGLSPNKAKGALARELAKKIYCMLVLAESLWHERP